MGLLRRAVRRAGIVVAAIAVVGGVAPATASAHPTGTTLLTVTRVGDVVEFDALIPLHRLELVLETELTDQPAAAIAEHDATLRTMFVSGVTITTRSGNEWPLTIRTLELGTLEGVDQLHARFAATPPDGEPSGDFTLAYRVVTDVIVTHNVYVATPPAGDDPTQLLGVINQRHPSLAISLEQPHATDFGTMVRSGIDHFRSGTDHIIFITLVAAASAFARARQRRRITELAMRTTAFTIGHSLSLTLAVAGALSPPSRPVETAIAVTVLLGAVHLVRPIIPLRIEPTMALVFGFIHGFGFAGTLGSLGVSGWALLVPIFGFNLGLELAQLGADLVIAPPLWWLARHRQARLVIALPAAAIACAWIIERTFSTSNPLEPMVMAVAASPERLAMVIALAAATAALLSRILRRPEELLLPPPAQRDRVQASR